MANAIPSRSGRARRTGRGRDGRAHHIRALVELVPDATVVADRAGRIQVVNQQTAVLFGYTRDELLGQPVEMLLPERLHGIHTHHRAQYTAAPRPRSMGVGLSLLGRHHDGHEFPVEVSLSPLDADDGSLVIASIRDLTEVQRVEAARQAAEQANQELRQLQALTDTALAYLSLDDLLPALLPRVREVMAVDNIAILLLEADGQTLLVRAALGLEEAVTAQMRVPLGQGFAGCIAASRAPLVVDDLATFPVANSFLREHLRSAAGVPLLLGERLLGVLHVGTAEPHHFTEWDVQLLQRAADRVAMAVERARLYDGARAAYAAERQARRSAEAALAQAQASERRFQRLVEAGIIGIAVSDMEHIIEANDAFLQMVGYTRDDVAAGRVRRAVVTGQDPADIAATQRALQEARTHGASAPFEREYVRKDGSHVPVLVGFVLLERDPLRFVNFVVDLSERKQLEDEREVARREADTRASELDAIFTAIADGIIVYDRDGHMLQSNPANRTILGGEAQWPAYFQRPIAERLQQLDLRDEAGHPLPPEQWPHLRVLRGEVLAGPTTVEVLARDLDGQVKALSISGAPLRDEAGTITGAVCVHRDVTARRQLEWEREEALRSREEWFHTMADTAPVLLWVAGTDALVTFLNAPWLQFTGRSLEQELGNGWAEGVHPDDYQRCLETYLAAFHARQPFTMEYRLRRFDGQYRWIVDSGVPRFAPDGAFLGYIGSAIDITEREQLEREREEARANELAVREVNGHLDEFFKTAAHDIRSPVTVVQGNGQLALLRFDRLQRAVQTVVQAAVQANSTATTAAAVETADLDKLDKLLSATHASLLEADEGAERLARLVARLFDMARARTGTLEVQPAPCDLAAFVRKQVAALRTAAPGRTLLLEGVLDAPDQPVPVLADADRLGQVLDNYLTNALKYSTDDQPVEVRLEVVAGMAVVSVRDAGLGLPPDEQVRVWALFHRAPGVEVQSRTAAAGTSSGSLGLGLHICKRIIELHHGQVGVESEVGHGSTFWFTLPLADAAGATPAPSASQKG